MTDADPSERVELRIVSDPQALAAVRKRTEQLALAHGFDAKAAGEIGLCMNEALANIIRHAYANVPGRPIQITLLADTDGLEAVIRDWGNGQLPNPHADHIKDQTAPGGLGLLCLQKLMDEVRYEPHPDGMELTMRRYR